MTMPTDSSDGRMPLAWASGYFLSHDGVVSRADGRALAAVTLAQARRYARQDIRHDPLRTAKSGVMQGRGGAEGLTGEEDGVQTVQFVRLKSGAELTQAENAGSVAFLPGFTMPAVGNVDQGWYWMRADDGAWCLLHGASYARHCRAK
jgi:hypothetical protein